jgi:endonuclease YncB( thermonuclease family)
VLSVGDGDTLRVSTGSRPITIRLACIDAPETAQSPWGQQSRAYLIQRLPRAREVSIQPHTTDRYGRTVAEVISDININLVMVEDGQAFAYRRYLNGCDAKEYLDAEFRASRHRYGVWQVEGGITRPWDFRRGRTAAVIPDGTTPGGRRYRCREIGCYARAQELLKQGHSYLDSNGDGEACESLR